MRSDILRQFEFEFDYNINAVVTPCPECGTNITAINLDQTLKAATRHIKRHNEAQENLIIEGMINEYFR